jgi:diketogulonate reductase-like aldo/keto reductase
MEKYYNNGKLKPIGISNYYTENAINKVLRYASITPAIIQNENHIYYQNIELKDYIKKY